MKKKTFRHYEHFLTVPAHTVKVAQQPGTLVETKQEQKIVTPFCHVVIVKTRPACYTHAHEGL